MRTDNPIPAYIRKGDTVAFDYEGEHRVVRSITFFRAQAGHICIKGITADGYRCFNGDKIDNIRRVN